MIILIATCAFALFYVACTLLSYAKVKWQDRFLMMVLCIFTILIGIRKGWPDQNVYAIAFKEAPLPWEIDWSGEFYGYVEHGYLLLASIVKLVYNNTTFYFLVMGGLSMFLLYKGLKKYCAIPLLGLCDYVGRFMLNRDFQQMRSSLAILLMVWGIVLIRKKKMWQYLLLILACYQIHNMAILGLPLYFMCLMKWKRWHIILGVALAFVFSLTITDSISSMVDAYSSDLHYSSYTISETNEAAKGLRNPMIYFQLAILFTFMFMESKLEIKSAYYFVFRTGYFYSTLFLILFCNYEALSGRTSTMYATLEMFIIPLICNNLPKKKRTVFYVGCGVVFLYFFHSKLLGAMTMMGRI